MSQPNIFLIVFDTLRKDTLFRNLDKLPNFRDLIRVSTVYSNAISPAPWTIPTHASIFTGQYPLEHGLRTRFSIEEFLQGIAFFKTEEKTLPRILAQQGYYTVSITANEFVGDGTAFAGIFDEVHSVGPIQYYFQIGQQIRKLAKAESLTTLAPAPVHISNLLRDAGILNTGKIFRLTLEREVHLKKVGFPVIKGGYDVLRQLGSLNPKGPYFVFLNFMEMHEPYQSFKDFESVQSYFLRSKLTGNFSNRGHFDKILNNWKKDSLREIKILDDYLGKIVLQLKTWVLFDDSILIVTSDHGQSFGENDFVGHGYMLNDSLVSVPCLIKNPKNLHSTNEKYVSLTDLFGFISACKEGEYSSFPVKDYVFSEAYGINQLLWKSRLGDLSEEYFPEIRKRIWSQTGENVTVNGSNGKIESAFFKNGNSIGGSNEDVLETLLQEMEIFIGSDKFVLPTNPKLAL